MQVSTTTLSLPAEDKFQSHIPPLIPGRHENRQPNQVCTIINTEPLQSEKPGSKLKRLSSFPNVMSPFSSFKRSFSRNRQISQESSSSKKSRKSSAAITAPSSTNPSRKSSASFAHPRTPPPTPRYPPVSKPAPTQVPARSQLPRSTTTSYLQLHPQNDESISQRPMLPHSRTTTVLPRSRIPTPSNQQARLPTPLDPTGSGVHQYHLGHSRRESYVLFQSDEPRPPTRIPTPLKRSSVDYAKVKHIGASRAFADVGDGHHPVRSKTESNLLAAIDRKPVRAGRRESSFRESFRPDSSTAPLIESSAENNPSFSPYKYDDSYENGLSPTGSFDGGVQCAEYAFSPRKYTPSKALENAMAASANTSPLKDQTNRPRTPSTIKRLENSTAAPSQPRLSSGHMIKSYQLLQPIQPADAPTPQLPRLASSNSLQTPRAPTTNPNRPSVSRPTPLRTSTELNSTDELSPTPTAPANSLAWRLMRQVTSFQPPSYWAGRFMSLHDRMLNESFDVDSRPTSSSDILRTRPSADGRSSSRSTLPAYADTELDRCRRIFEELEGRCGDYDALRSLRAFQNAYAKRNGVSALECDVPPELMQLIGATAKSSAVKAPTPGLGLAKTGTKESSVSAVSGDGAGGGASAPRKTSFMDRLWMARGRPGKGRKSSGKSGEDDRKGLMSGES